MRSRRFNLKWTGSDIENRVNPDDKIILVSRMQAVYQQGGEVIFGIVGAAGTNLLNIESVLRESLLARNYQSVPIRLSQLLHEVGDWKNIPSELAVLQDKIRRHMYEDERITAHMDLGNVIRGMFSRGDAVALLAIGAIRKERSERKSRRGTNGSLDEETDRTAYILNSLKNPMEVSTLRQIYGRRFFLIAAYSPRDKRVEELAKSIGNSHDSLRFHDFTGLAQKLAERDESEGGLALGQNVRDTFPLADVFVDATNPTGETFRFQIKRFVELVFGNPLHTPTRDEYGMFHAYAAASRSGALSRQVGASIADSDGGIVSLGANEVPKAGGGFYWPDDPQDSRDIQRGFDQRDKMEKAILKEILERLQRHKWLVVPPEYSVDQLVTISTIGPIDQIDKARALVKRIHEGESAAAQELLTLIEGIPIESKKKDKIKQLITEIVEKKVRADAYLTSLVDEALSPVMRGAMLTDLTEYSRAVHAEMAALIEALRHGVSVKDLTLYSTTFPCHVCTRNTVASGIGRVIYIEPYPKSYAEEQHGDAITVDKTREEGKVSFAPFVGVAPRQFLPFFLLEFFDRKRKDEQGQVIRPTMEENPVFREPPMSYMAREIDAYGRFERAIRANWLA